MKMRRQPRKHLEPGVIVKFAHNPLAAIQNLVRQRCKDVGFGAFTVDLDQIDLRDSELAQDIVQPPDFAFHRTSRMTTVFEAPARVERTEVNLIRLDRYALINRSQAIIENLNTRQAGNILFQDPKRPGMRFESENFRGGKLAIKINNGSADVAANIENDFRFKSRRHVVLRFLAAPEQHLIDHKWIGRARPIKNIPAMPAQSRQRRARRLARDVRRESHRARTHQDFDQVAKIDSRHDPGLTEFAIQHEP